MRGQCWMLQVRRVPPWLGTMVLYLSPLMLLWLGPGPRCYIHYWSLSRAGHTSYHWPATQTCCTLHLVSWSPATVFQWHVKTEEKYRFTLTHLHEHHIFLFLFLLELKVCGGCRLRLALCWSSNSLINISFKDHVQSPAAEQQQPVVLAFKPAASNCNCHVAEHSPGGLYLLIRQQRGPAEIQLT